MRCADAPIMQGNPSATDVRPVSLPSQTAQVDSAGVPPWLDAMLLRGKVVYHGSLHFLICVALL